MQRSLIVTTALVTSMSMILNAPATAQTAQTSVAEPSAEASQACETPVGEPCESNASLTVEQAGNLKADQMDAELSADMDPAEREKSIADARTQAEDAQRAFLETQGGANANTDTAASSESAPALPVTDPSASGNTAAASSGVASGDSGGSDLTAAARSAMEAAGTDSTAGASADTSTSETVATGTSDTTTTNSGADTMATTSTDGQATTTADPAADTTASTDTSGSGDATTATSSDTVTAAGIDNGTDANTDANTGMAEAGAGSATGTDTQTGTQTAGTQTTDGQSGSDLSQAAAMATAAAAATDSEAEAQVTEETVTEESVRTSDEDFANAVGEAPASEGAQANTGTNAAVGANTTASSDSGLSDTEKAILGLGALAVGAAVLANSNREVVANSGDRVVVRDGEDIIVLKDDNALLRQPGNRVETATYNDGSTKQTITRDDGTQIVTVRDAELRVLRRVRIGADGQETVLFDDTIEVRPVDRVALQDTEMQPEIQSSADEEALRAALARDPNLGRTYSLAQVRNTAELRAVAPAVSLEAVTFRSGSAAIEPAQVDALVQLGEVIKSSIQERPGEVFLIEGHTDAVGNDAYNLALSDRRAETVALALTEYFDVPPENLVVQGYGEKFLKVATQTDERRNRRAVVRRITPLLTASR